MRLSLTGRWKGIPSLSFRRSPLPQNLIYLFLGMGDRWILSQSDPLFPLAGEEARSEFYQLY